MWSFFQVGVVVIGIGLLVRCKEPQQTVVITPEGPPAVAESLEDVLEENPELVESVPGKKYIIKIVPPEPEVEYMMPIIRPDSNFDFKMRIINPGADDLSPEQVEKPAEAIREKMQAESEEK